MKSKFQISNIKYQINTNIVEKIIKQTKRDLEKRKKRAPLSANVILSEAKSELAKRRIPRSFGECLRMTEEKMAIIGEIKLASPTSANLGSESEIIKRVKEYERAGIPALSIVTEKHFFKGDTSFVEKAKKISRLPILQKDFVVDAYQIYEAKKIGSDAILLIARILTKKELVQFVDLAKAIGIEPVVEIHSGVDLAKAIETKTKIIAVNARDLNRFKVDVDRACKLLKKVPSKFIKLGFSGIHSASEVKKYKKAGVQGVLIGTSLMKAENIEDFVKNVRGSCPGLHPISARSSFAVPLAGADELRADRSPSPVPPAKYSVKVKICGIRSLEAAKAAVDAGADYLGFNFVPTSKRYIMPIYAKEIIEKVKSRVKIVGVFQNATLNDVNNIVKDLSLDFVQLHRDESLGYVKEVGAEVIRAFSLPKAETMLRYSASLYLLDREKQGKGEMVDLEEAKEIAKQVPLFFSGGLTPENVAYVVSTVRPFGVDVAGGVETDGMTDPVKVKTFIQNIRRNLFK